MYQALYRKYRPQTFSDVVGQRSVTDTLRTQLSSGKLSHAYLFTGTRGTGKTSCAKILSKAVNCLDLQDGNPCNHCAACKAIDSGACMDVLEIDAASNNGVDSVRVLRDDAIYTPSEVRMRVYIIDEVHMLSTAAFNALLKIIEEPPEHLLFILATTELHKVPATILSRCQRFSFRRLSQEDIAARLNYIAYQENIEVEPAAIAMLSRLADGGMRDGVSLLDQCASASGGKLTADSVTAALGLAGQKQTAALLRAAAERNCADALKIFSELYAAGKDIPALVSELSGLCRDLLILKTAPQGGISMLSGVASGEQAAALSRMLSQEELLRDLQLLQQTAADFSKNADSRVAMELCLIRMCEPQLSLDVQALAARVSRMEEQLASGSFVKSAAQAQTTEDPAPYDEDRPPFPDDADDPLAQAQAPAEPEDEPKPQKQAQTAFWPELCQRIREDLGVRERGFFAPEGPVQPVLRGSELILTCQNNFILDMVKKPETEALAKEKAALVLGRPVSVRFALQSQVSNTGEDPMDALLAVGRQHQDIFTIK